MKDFTLKADYMDSDGKTIMSADTEGFDTLEEAVVRAKEKFSATDWHNPAKPYVYVSGKAEDTWVVTIVDEVASLMDYYNPPGKGWTWYSICSGHSPRADGSHHWPDTECDRCMAGHWVNDEEQAEDHKLHDEDYPAWYRKHNGPDSQSRKFLTKIFPNLR